MNDRAVTTHALPPKRSSADLAHDSDFRLGRTLVRPSLLQVQREAQPPRSLEPRIMQVLVVLARADGDVVSRGDLIECCWGGRVVGDNAINRVVSRLRQLAAGICAGDFEIETIARVGYRLKPSRASAAGRAVSALPSDAAQKARGAVAPAEPPWPAALLPSRRRWLNAALAAAVACGLGGLAGAAWFTRRHPNSRSLDGTRARHQQDHRRHVAVRR